MTNKLIVLSLLIASAFSSWAQDSSPAPFAWQTTISAPIQTFNSSIFDFRQAMPRYLEPLPGGKWRVYQDRFAQVLGANGAPGALVQSVSDFNAFTSPYSAGPRTTLTSEGGTASVDGADPFDRLDDPFGLLAGISPANGRGSCIVRRYFASGELAWRTQLENPEYQNCTGVLAVQDQIWAIADGKVIRLATDGARLGSTLLGGTGGAMSWSESAADSDGAYFVGRNRLSAEETAQSPQFKSTIVRLNAAGVEQWRSTAVSTERYRFAVTLPDGVLFASELTSPLANGEFELIKLDRSGIERFRRQVPGKILALALDPSSHYRAVFAIDSNKLALAYFDERGLLTRRLEIVASPNDNAGFEFAGNSLLMCDGLKASVFNRAGLIRAELSSGTPENAGVQPCGARLSLDGEALLGYQRKSCADRDCFELVRINLSSGAQSRWPVPDRRELDRQLEASFEVQGGVLVSSQIGSLSEIQFIDALGAVRWQRDVASVAQLFPNRILANAEIYCVVKFFVPTPCYGIADNALRFSTTVPETFGAIILLADRFLLNESRDNSILSAVKALDLQGNLLFQIDEPGLQSAQLSEAGIYGFTPQGFVRWNTRGQLMSRHAVAFSQEAEVALLNDGILYVENGTLGRLSLDGAVRWRINAQGNPGATINLALIGDRVVVVKRIFSAELRMIESSVQLYSAQTGALIRAHDIEAFDTRVVKTPMTGAPIDRITVVGTGARYAEVRYVLDSQSGDLIDVQSSDLGISRALSQTQDQFPVSTDNYLIRTITNEFSETELLVAKRQFNARASLPIANPGFIGAWYNPQTPGQGFFMQRIGDVQFLTWFFSLPSFELDPARLSWLSLQGTTPANSQLAELKIYRSAGGSFLNAPAPLAQIGSAQLSFQSCGDATLRYIIEQREDQGSRNGPPERGVIALKSLLPATSCAGPLSLPAPVSAKTGLFSDPALAGQGMMTVENQGTLFAGWFTFDPAGASDDSYSHSWFTLQGSTAPGVQLVQTQIYRTIGSIRNRSQRASQLAIGTAEFDFQDCRTLLVTYRFFDAEAALAMRGKTGAVRLARNGACPAP